MSVNGSDSVRAEIRAVALELFSQVGFHGTGIRRIAEEAGVSLATLYHYMSSKEALLVELMVGNIVSLLRDAELALNGLTGPVERLDALVRVHVRVHVQDRMLCIVSDTEIRSLSPENHDLVVRYRDDNEHLWKRTITEGRKSGDFTVSDIDVATKALLDLCTGVVHWYRSDGRVDLDALSEMYVELCLRALTSQKPRRRQR